ncbi:MAG: acetolactate decarboxylase [Desulfobacterales bacterium]
MKKKCMLFCIVLFLGAGCAGNPYKDTVTQTSTIDILLAGVYEGDMTLGELTGYGDFGIGTFNRLDGEMILLDGEVYKVRADGRVYRPGNDEKTPFAAVSRFEEDTCIKIKEPVSRQELQSLIDDHINDPHLFYAIRITGKFSEMRTRSVPAQQKPYPPLTEVAKKQPEFEMKDISGTIVGYRCPVYVKGINVAGYHLHFISSSFRQGGHILDFEMSEGRTQIDTLSRFTLIMPDNAKARHKLDLSLERSRELKEVEQ